jgi:hypothetical protein
LLYSFLRVVVLGVALGLGYALGLRSWLLWIVAVVLAAAASYLFLRAPRDAAAAQLAAGAGRRRARPVVDLDAQHEDAADEEARRRSDGEGDAEERSVEQLGEARVPQDEHEVAPRRPAEHTPGETPGGQR